MPIYAQISCHQSELIPGVSPVIFVQRSGFTEPSQCSRQYNYSAHHSEISTSLASIVMFQSVGVSNMFATYVKSASWGSHICGLDLSASMYQSVNVLSKLISFKIGLKHTSYAKENPLSALPSLAWRHPQKTCFPEHVS